MSDFTQQEQQEDSGQRLSNELNQLIAHRDSGLQQEIDPNLDPFGHVYVCIADMIIASTRMYIGLRGLEDKISGGEDAAQDA